MPRAKQRTPELRDHILQVAVATLGDDGTAGFTTRHVAGRAGTSTTAVYELFGDKAGLLRAVFFEGFRLLRARLDELADDDDHDDPVAGLLATLQAVRRFVREHPVLADLMFSRPFADFDPGPDELEAGVAVRVLIVDQVQHGIDAGRLRGNATDIAHVLLALVQGLAAQESAGWLGTSAASVDRRWNLGLRAAIAGLRPG